MTNPRLDGEYQNNAAPCSTSWPKSITSNLWPQALKHATNVRNALPHPGKTQSPISLFANMIVEPNIKHFNPFGCLVYVLQAPLQNNGPFA